MPQPIQNPTVSGLLARAFNLTGRVRPSLDEIIVPTVSLGDLSEGSRPATRAQAISRAAQTAVAAQRFVMRFEIPGNLIAVIDELVLIPAAADNFDFDFRSTIPAPGSIATKSFTDGTLVAAGLVPAGVVSFGTQVGGLAAPRGVYRAPADGLSIKPGWVIGTGRPGQFGFMEVAAATLNQTVRATIRWTEYSVV